MLNDLHRHGARCVAVLLSAAILCAAPAGAQDKKTAPAKPQRQLSLQNEPWTGDFDPMLERRIIRVLAPYSRTLYFVDKGRERGITAELVRDFERYVNKKYAKQLGKRPLTVFLIPTTRDRLLSGLADGLGDIAAGNLTATEERLKMVDFVAPADSQAGAGADRHRARRRRRSRRSTISPARPCTCARRAATTRAWRR